MLQLVDMLRSDKFGTGGEAQSLIELKDDASDPAAYASNVYVQAVHRFRIWSTWAAEHEVHVWVIAFVMIAYHIMHKGTADFLGAP